MLLEDSCALALVMKLQKQYWKLGPHWLQPLGAGYGSLSPSKAELEHVLVFMRYFTWDTLYMFRL